MFSLAFTLGVQQGEDSVCRVGRGAAQQTVGFWSHTSRLAIKGRPDGGAKRSADLVGPVQALLEQSLVGVSVVSSGDAAGHSRQSGGSKSSLHLEYLVTRVVEGQVEVEVGNFRTVVRIVEKRMPAE